MEYKKFFYKSVFSIIAILLAIALLVVIVDPQFQYHKPLALLEYKLFNERYQNYGIVRHFDYNAVITGSSMVIGFKSSELDNLFGTNSIKIPFNGARYKEINQCLTEAFKNNKNIKMVIQSLDHAYILEDKNSSRYRSYPGYLYDNNYLNDVKYIFNNSTIFEYILANTLLYTQEGNKTTSFDDYLFWEEGSAFSKKDAIKKYNRTKNVMKEKGALTGEERKVIKENLEQNIIHTVKSNPQTEFYYFFPLYSTLYYDSENRNGMLDKTIEAMEYATTMLLEHDNIKLFSFVDNYDISTNLNNYYDATHYSPKINTLILQWIKEDIGLLTVENYKQHFDEIRKFYSEYNYNAIFE